MEDRGLVGDIAMGILVGKIQEMLGITTTPKPRPVLGILIIIIKIVLRCCLHENRIVFVINININTTIVFIININTTVIIVFNINITIIAIDGIAGLFGATTTTAAPATDEEK